MKQLFTLLRTPGRPALAALVLAVAAATWPAMAQAPAVTVDFPSLGLRDTPNEFLVCPAELCAAAEPHMAAPVYAATPADLRAAMLRVLAAQPRVEILGQDADGLAVVQRSALFGFEDLVDIRILPVDGTGATIAVYSRSVDGYYDFGVNEDRVRTWLTALEAELAAN